MQKRSLDPDKQLIVEDRLQWKVQAWPDKHLGQQHLHAAQSLLSPCVSPPAFLPKLLWSLLFPIFGLSSKPPTIGHIQSQDGLPLHLIKYPTLPGNDHPHFEKRPWELLPLICPVSHISSPGGTSLQMWLTHQLLIRFCVSLPCYCSFAYL